MSTTADNVTAGLPAARRRIVDALNGDDRLDVPVHLYGAAPGKTYGTDPLVEVATFGSATEPDLYELRIYVTCGGDHRRAEGRVDAVVQAIDDALPAYVASPEWSVAYDQDRKHWRASGTADAFR